MISNKWFPEEIIRIAKKIEKQGGELFLVGGSIRDLILKIRPEEYDFEIYGNIKKRDEYFLLEEAEKIEFIQAFIKDMKEALKEFGEISEHGKSFGVIKMAHKSYDFSFPRTENKTGIKRQDYHVSLNPFLDFKEAQRRRDITINTIMYSFSKEILIDNFKGLQDIQQKLIRHVDSNTFVEDPLRVYRIAQFISRFSFNVDSETLKLCQDMDLSSLSVERIQWEMGKLFKGKDILAGLNFLDESKVLIKRHFDFYNLFRTNKHRHNEINKIQYYINENMKMTERFLFIFLLFSDDFNENEFENYLRKVKRIFFSFTNNKKDIIQSLEKICNIKILADYYNEKTDYQKSLFMIINKDLKYLYLYFKFLYGENRKIEMLIDSAENFEELVKGKDLLEYGIKESDKFKMLLSEALKMQIAGLDKEEILLQIKRRELE